MRWPPPRSSRTDPTLPDTTLFLSAGAAGHADGEASELALIVGTEGDHVGQAGVAIGQVVVVLTVVRSVGRTELEAAEARGVVGQLRGVVGLLRLDIGRTQGAADETSRGQARTAEAGPVALVTRVQGDAVVGRRVVHLVHRGVLVAEIDLAEGALRVQIRLVDLVARVAVSLELNVDAELDAVVQRGRADEVDFRVRSVVETVEIATGAIVNRAVTEPLPHVTDRKSTRLNSSH